jgi:hypothetical protein
VNIPSAVTKAGTHLVGGELAAALAVPIRAASFREGGAIFGEAASVRMKDFLVDSRRAAASELVRAALDRDQSTTNTSNAKWWELPPPRYCGGRRRNHLESLVERLTPWRRFGSALSGIGSWLRDRFTPAAR